MNRREPRGGVRMVMSTLERISSSVSPSSLIRSLQTDAVRI